MNDFRKLLDSLNLQEETEKTVVPFAAPQATMPDDLALAAQNEAMDSAPVARAPAPIIPQAPKMADLGSKLDGAMEQAASTETRTKNSISGTLPQSDKADGDMTAEAKLEKLMRDLNEQRKLETEEASSRKFKADIAKAITDNVGTFVGGMQAKNTKAAVNPIQTKGYDVGDLVGQVDKRFAGDREALMDQYKQLLNARDRSEQRKFQQDTLSVQKRGLDLKEKALNQKDNKLDDQLTEAEKAADKKYGQDYNTFTSKGRTNAIASLNRLKELKKELEQDQGLLESGGGRASILPDALRSRDAIRRRDGIGNAANSTLKELFGGQLSDDERKAAAKEYYNDNLSNAENAKILDDKIKQLESGLESETEKARYYEKNRTLRGLGSASRPANNESPDSPTVPSAGTVKIQSPSGEVQTVSAEKAEKYLSRPGFKKVN